MGLSEKLYRIHSDLLNRAYRHLNNCNCEDGCPACVGPVNEVGLAGKENAHILIEEALSDEDWKYQREIETDGYSTKYRNLPGESEF